MMLSRDEMLVICVGALGVFSRVGATGLTLVAMCENYILSPFFSCTSSPHPRSTSRLMLQVILRGKLTINWQMIHQYLDVFIIEINFCIFNEIFHLI